MNVASEPCDSVEVKSASSLMIQMITQSVAASPWPASQDNLASSGGVFITSTIAVEPAIRSSVVDPAIKRSHSRNRVSLTQINFTDEDPRKILERLQPIPVIHNEANEKSVIVADQRKKTSWFSFFSLSRCSSSISARESINAAFKPKGILKSANQIDDSSSVSSTEITTSASPFQKVKRLNKCLRFDNEVRVCETFHREDYSRESVEYVAKQLTPSVAAAIKRELNEIKQEMEIHEEARHLTQFYVIK